MSNQVHVIFKYAVSDKLRNAETIATGERLSGQRQLEIGLADLTPEQRAVVIDATVVSDHKLLRNNPRHKVAAFSQSQSNIIVELEYLAIPDSKKQSYGLYAEQQRVERDELLTPETAVAATAKHTAALSRAITFDEALTAEKLAAWQECADIFAADEAAAVAKAKAAGIADWVPPGNRSSIGYMQRVAEQERQLDLDKQMSARKRQENERREAEKAAWIAEHGSAHLREAFGRGYDSQRQYVLERARMEAPSWTLDFNDSAHWNSRSFPSVEALRVEDEAKALAEKLDSRTVGIVWLIKPPSSGHRDDDGDWDFEQCEAVAIREYLGQYDLVKMIA